MNLRHGLVVTALVAALPLTLAASSATSSSLTSWKIPCTELELHSGNGYVVPFPGPAGTFTHGVITCTVTIKTDVYGGLPAWKVTAPDGHYSYFTASRTDPPEGN